MGFTDWLLGKDPEKYDPNTEQGIAARTLSGPRHDYDVNSSYAQGSQLNVGNYNQVRGEQLGLGQTLKDAIAGKGPSAAGMAAQAQRDAALSNAAALTAGRRGRSGALGAIAANNAASAGISQAGQNEAIGRAQEMAQARGEYGGLLSGMAGQDINIAGQNANLAQNAAQFNARLQQEAALANQAAQMGISVEELKARQQQEAYSYSNLDPGSQGALGGILAAGGALAGGALGGVGGAKLGAGIGGSIGGSFASGGVVMPQYQTIRAGERRMPIQRNGIGPTILQALIEGLGSGLTSYDAAKKEKQLELEKAKAQRDAELQNQKNEEQLAMLKYQLGIVPQTPIATDFSNMVRGQAYAKGGMAHGPQIGLVGEAGPEAVLNLKTGLGKVVTKPTLMKLGANGPDAIVPLTNPLHQTLSKALKRK